MSRADKLKRRLPKVLSDKLDRALDAVHGPEPEKRMELLTIYRRNRAKRIATWGVLNIGAPVEGLKPFPWEHIQYIVRLDKAFNALRAYMNGGADDYIAAGVVSAISSIHAREPREIKNDYEEICRWLRRKGYETSGNKKALVEDAKANFKTSESTVRKALRAGGMTRNKQTTVS